MTGPIDDAVSVAREIVGDGATPTEFFTAVHEVAHTAAQSLDPLPDGFFPAYELDPDRNGCAVPEYELVQVSNSGKIIPPLVDVVDGYLMPKAGRGDKLAGEALSELRMILAINPPDPLLADYRALRLRGFFEAFVRNAVNAVVSPDGSTNAARLISADGGFRRDALSELARFMLASLVSGSDKSLAGAVRVYVEAVR